jgi:hypothetical protein
MREAVESKKQTLLLSLSGSKCMETLRFAPQVLGRRLSENGFKFAPGVVVLLVTSSFHVFLRKLNYSQTCPPSAQ